MSSQEGLSIDLEDILTVYDTRIAEANRALAMAEARCLAVQKQLVMVIEERNRLAQELAAPTEAKLSVVPSSDAEKVSKP